MNPETKKKLMSIAHLTIVVAALLATGFYYFSRYDRINRDLDSTIKCIIQFSL